MIENSLIRFDPSLWGYDFTCSRCGAHDSAEGEAPVSAMDAMRERDWAFEYRDGIYLPICPACDNPEPEKKGQ